MKVQDMLKVGVIGYGYWGPNIVRNFHALPNCKVVAVCDKSPKALQQVSASYQGIACTPDANDIITSKDIDAVAIVTPVSTHYELARQCIANGKHVFVEKPFTATVVQAERLIELAEKKRRTLMVDHIFLFTGAVKKIKELIEQKMLGTLHYYDSVRVNLGLFQHDINVLWDLAPHDLSIMDYLIEAPPEAVVATGASHVNCLEDVAYITIYFPNNTIAHMHVNWLSPVKVRTTLIGGEQKMVVWNDLEVDEKIKIYDKGVSVTSQQGVYDLLVSYRSGDMWAPKVEQTEALKIEAQYFVDCILHNETPVNDGKAGRRIVQLLEAADKSLKQRGQIVQL
jgi:predicted dehydrogenase